MTDGRRRSCHCYKSRRNSTDLCQTMPKITGHRCVLTRTQQLSKLSPVRPWLILPSCRLHHISGNDISRLTAWVAASCSIKDPFTTQARLIHSTRRHNSPTIGTIANSNLNRKISTRKLLQFIRLLRLCEHVRVIA